MKTVKSNVRIGLCQRKERDFQRIVNRAKVFQNGPNPPLKPDSAAHAEICKLSLTSR
jgi:hypothetical protein